MADIETARGSTFLIVCTVLCVLLAVSFSFFKYFLERDFLLFVKESCDPSKESCFVHECETDDVRCSQLSTGKFFYKIVFKKDYKTSACVGSKCSEVKCDKNEEFCFVYYCSDATLSKFDLADSCSNFYEESAR